MFLINRFGRSSVPLKLWDEKRKSPSPAGPEEGFLKLGSGFF
jgi:hypothetical protein